MKKKLAIFNKLHSFDVYSGYVDSRNMTLFIKESHDFEGKRIGRNFHSSEEDIALSYFASAFSLIGYTVEWVY